MKEKAIDLIGDLHGHYDELRALLGKLGYVEKNGAFHYPRGERMVVFLGDYVDRGPKIRETLRLVRAMVESGSAVALLGNHEFNMLSFWHRNGGGGRFLKRFGNGYLRKHTFSNVATHARTVMDFAGHEDEFRSMLDFVKSLPIYLETECFRAQHACCDYESIAILKSAGVAKLTDGDFDTLLYRANDKDNEYGDSIFAPIETILKGPEFDLPNGVSFCDKDGKRRTKTRLRWWNDPAKSSLAELSMVPLEASEEGLSLVPESLRARSFYGANESPVFFGHYWFTGEPHIMRSNVCCLDYSVASQANNGGRLVAYRFDGELELDDRKFVWVGSAKVS